MKISVVTTVFNRKKELLRLYKSLFNQNQKNFEWVIIDDGSTDGTIDYLKQHLSNYLDFEIKIIEKQNEGKHIALNKAFEIIKSDVTIIIDSDDVALSNMIKKVTDAWRKNNRLDDSRLGAIIFERQDFSGNILRKIPDKESRMNISLYRRKNNFVGDYAETFKTNVLKQYKFPKFQNETFLSEGFIWADLNKKYDGIFIDDSIYMAEYQEDGLTAKAHEIQWENPIGTLAVCKKNLPTHISSKADLKAIVKYMVFSYKNHKNIFEMISKVDNKFLSYLLIIPSYFLYKVMQFKYEK